MALVSDNKAKSWYKKDHFIYKNFKYIFQNPLWQNKVPKAFSLCPYFWMSMIVGLICVRLIVVPVGILLTFLLTPIKPFVSKVTFKNILNVFAVIWFGGLAILGAYVVFILFFRNMGYLADDGFFTLKNNSIMVMCLFGPIAYFVGRYLKPRYELQGKECNPMTPYNLWLIPFAIMAVCIYASPVLGLATVSLAAIWSVLSYQFAGIYIICWPFVLALSAFLLNVLIFKLCDKFIGDEKLRIFEREGYGYSKLHYLMKTPKAVTNEEIMTYFRSTIVCDSKNFPTLGFYTYGRTNGWTAFITHIIDSVTPTLDLPEFHFTRKDFEDFKTEVSEEKKEDGAYFHFYHLKNPMFCLFERKLEDALIDFDKKSDIYQQACVKGDEAIKKYEALDAIRFETKEDNPVCVTFTKLWESIKTFFDELKDYFKANKQGWCPLYYFEEFAKDTAEDDAEDDECPEATENDLEDKDESDGETK